MTHWTKFSEKVRVDIDSSENLKESGNYNIGFTDSSDGLNTINITPSQTNDSTNRKLQDDVKNIKWLYTICCMSSQNNNYDVNLDEAKQQKLTKEEEAKQDAKNAQEEGLWADVCNVMAMILVAFSGFIWGFYA